MTVERTYQVDVTLTVEVRVQGPADRRTVENWVIEALTRARPDVAAVSDYLVALGGVNAREVSNRQVDQ